MQAHASIPLASLHGADPLPPYVRLIHDVLLGDRSLFTRPDGLAAVWDVAEPLLSTPPAVSTYSPGSWGPAQASDLIAPGRWLLAVRRASRLHPGVQPGRRHHARRVRLPQMLTGLTRMKCAGTPATHGSSPASMSGTRSASASR